MQIGEFHCQNVFFYFDKVQFGLQKGVNLFCKGENKFSEKVN